MNYILYIIYVILIIGPIYLIWAIMNINRKMKKVDWLNAQEYTILRIDVPKNNDKSPLAAEQMFAAIHGIYSESASYQNHLSFEIVSKDKFIQFYVYLPVHLKDFVEGQIYAQYPTVEIQEVGDYTQEIDPKSQNYATCELGLNKPDVYPIKQFTDFEVDPISGITSVMTKLNAGEEIWFQVMIKPIGDEWQEKGHEMVSHIRSGTSISGKGLLSKFNSTLKGFGKAFFIQLVKPGEAFDTKPVEVKLHASVEEALKNIEQKITKLGFETKMRILALGGDSVSARMKCQNVAAAFKQYNTTHLNGFKIGEVLVNDHSAWKDFAERSFEDDGKIFNISELASIYHLPHSSVSTPNIVWSGSKKGEPPANLPLRENTPEDELTVIGETNFRNNFKVFGIKKDDRRRHIYIVGKSGVGKSVLIENMAVNDVCSGRGVIVVDPHGELADKVLSCIPENRIKDVVVFDPSDREFPVAFNLLEHVDDDFKSIVASGFVGIFKKIFGDSWGPRLEHILRNTVLALLDFPDSTMLDIPRMLTNNRFREKVVERVKDPIIKEFWLNEFASFDSKFRTEAVSPILNKVGQFLSSATIRHIVGQPKSTINIREIMDQKKIMIVNLSRGKIGEDNSALLGAMMITKVQLAAMSRADVTVDNRPDSYLYVDEFQNFATESFAVILAEARKYNLNLTMAHQYIAQLKEEVREAVFGNAGTIISFRVGGADADTLVKEFEPVFETNDMVNLDKYHIYIKLLVDGVSSPAFSARTLPPVQKLTGNLEAVINNSRSTYSRTRAEVEGMIMHRSQEEEEELKAEAEAFKQGGLEALLSKKPVSVGTTPSSEEKRGDLDVEIIQEPVPIKWINPEKTESKETTDTLKTNTDSSEPKTESAEVKKSDGPRVVKYDSILDGKIYKERTARGGVKWYLGEEIDEEKLAKNKILLDDGARNIIELSKEVATKKNKSEHNSPKHAKSSHEIGGSSSKKAETEDSEKTEEKSETKMEDSDDPKKNTEDEKVESRETQIEPEKPVANDSEINKNASETDPKHLEEGQAVKIDD